MNTMAELVGRELKWTQPAALKMQYELRAGDDIAALLRFRSAWGSLATGESGDGCWTFKRVGFLHTSVNIRICDQETDTAVFRNSTWSGGGTLELPDGQRLLASTNLWQSKLEFKREDGEALLQFKTGGVLHMSAEVEIHPEAYSMVDLPWIVILGWYLTVMMSMDSIAAIGAIG